MKVVVNNQFKQSTDSFRGTRSSFCAANTVFNIYPHKVECIHYKRNFFCRRSGFVESESDKKFIDRSRKFRINAAGIVEPKTGNVLLSDLIRNCKRSRKRSIDSCFSYLLANDWNYFCTFTFDGDKVELSDSAIIYSWSKFRQVLQYHYPFVRIFAIPERHKSGVIHFHALLGGADLSNSLVGAVNPHSGEDIFTQFGDRIYNFDDNIYKYGFTTIVPIASSDDRDRVVNYLTKYVTKSGILGYNMKSYFHTHGLKRRKKIVAFTDYNELFGALSYTPDSNSLLDFNLRDGVLIRKITDNYFIFDLSGSDVCIYSQNNTFTKR